MSHRLAKLAVLVAAATAIGSIAVPAAHADWTYWHAQLDVQYPSAGMITSDQSDSGNSINCGADFGSPGPCTITDSVPGGSSTRPTSGWYSYTLARRRWSRRLLVEVDERVLRHLADVHDRQRPGVHARSAGEWVDTQGPVTRRRARPGCVPRAGRALRLGA